MEGNRSFVQVRKEAVWFIESAVKSYESVKGGFNNHLKEAESGEAFARIRFASMLGLISPLEVDDYYIRIDKEYLVEKRA